MTPAITPKKPGGAWAAPRPFQLYTVALSSLAAVGLGIALLTGSWSEVAGDKRFWPLALFVVIGEQLPIDVPRRGDSEQVTISTAFAFAVLLMFGIAPAIVVYTVAVIVADVALRRTAIKIVFNVAQYVVSLAIAGAVLAALAPVPVTDVAAELPAILLAGFTWFAVNHILVGIGGALLARAPIAGHLTGDLMFQGWTAGFLLTLAPLVLTATDAGLVLIPLAFAPMLAIYVGGRQAAMNEHRATHDQLTGLPNRNLLQARLGSELAAAAPGEEVAVMIMAIEDVATISETLGQQSGDALIAGLAPRIQEALTDDDFLARLGGDEFGVVLVGASAADGGRTLAQHLLGSVSIPCNVGELSITSSASIGIASHPEHGSDPGTLLRRAEVALAAAKDAGTGWRTYVAQGDERGMSRLALAEQLRRGIEAGEIVVHYQPKVALPEGTPHAVEALVRWQHPELGLVGPDGFIPLAEKTGLIAPLTQVVLDTALRQCHDWRKEGLAPVMAVNISTQSLRSRDVVWWIKDGLRRWSVDPQQLQLEVTESTIVSDIQRAEELLNEIRELGVSIAIDDFGTGFSSLAQLQQLPIDEIKIDKSFVMDMESNPRNAAIVRATIELARELGLAVTAEGVETAGAYEQLGRLGCNYAQGYLMSRPIDAADCTAFMHRSAEGLTIPPLAGERR